ncbi:MAG TPA: hypothetical protein VF708_09190 [Pyrinomonadaceae bacterium]|jgi:hypothetical protein
MKVFVDECVTYLLMAHFTRHDFTHILDTPWRGMKNGALLRLVASEYDVFLTTDRHIPHQQNLRKLNLAFVIIHGVSNKIDDLLPLAPKTIDALDHISPGDLVIISA